VAIFPKDKPFRHNHYKHVAEHFESLAESLRARGDDANSDLPRRLTELADNIRADTDHNESEQDIEHLRVAKT